MLVEKGIPYENRTVVFDKYETYEPWYLRMNPQGQVPMLKHKDKIVYDSKDIMAYLDKTFKGIYSISSTAKRVAKMLLLFYFYTVLINSSSPGSKGEDWTDLSISMKFGVHVDQNILNSFFEGAKAAIYYRCLASETTGSSTEVLHPNSSDSVATCKITCFCLLASTGICFLLKATFHNPGFLLARL